MEHPQVIPIHRVTTNSVQTSNQLPPEGQPVSININVTPSNGEIRNVPGTWPMKTDTMTMPGQMAPFQPMPNFQEQMRKMQEDMQRMQSGLPFFPSPFPQMQPFQNMPAAQDTQPRVDNMGNFRLTPQSQWGMAGMPSISSNGPLDIPDVVVKCKDGTTKFLLKYDVSDFKPGEVKVEITGKQLKVSGNHEEVSGNSVIKRTYHKEHPLPDGVKDDELRSVLSPEGILTITAPVVGNVPIQPQTNQPMISQHPAPVPAQIMQQQPYQHPATLPRDTGKRRVKFCEGDP